MVSDDDLVPLVVAYARRFWLHVAQPPTALDPQPGLQELSCGYMGTLD